MPFSDDILGWNDQLKSQAANFFNTAQEVVDYMMPSHRQITTTATPGTKQTQKIFDSTALDAIVEISSFLSGALFSEGDLWFDVRMMMEEYNRDGTVADYLQTVRNVQLASLRHSNFYATTVELMQDWIAFGNLCLLQEYLQPKPPNYPRLVFTPVGYGSYVFFEGEDKRPEGMIRELDMSAKECVDKFGDTCSEQIAEAARKTPFRQFRIVHAITPRKMVQYKRLATPKDMPWASCWFEAGKKGQKPLLESGYKEKPFAIARYNVIAGEVMARGLGEIALPHVKTINGAVMRGFMEWDKSLDPPVNTLINQVVGDLSHRAGGRNIIKRAGAIELMDKDLRSPNVTHQWNLEDLRKQVREIFRVEALRQLIGVQGQPQKEQTAFEYGKKLELVHLIMAPTGGRLQSEALRDIIETNYAINYRIGAFPPLPDILIEASKSEQGNQTVITYEGPLAQSQRNQQLGTMREFLQGVGMVAQLDPGAVDIPNIDEFVRKEAEIRGIGYLLNDPKTTDQIKQLKGKLQQMQMQLQAAEQMSQIAKNAAPMVSAMQNGQQNGAQNGQAA